jgi:hypothetical protein
MYSGPFICLRTAASAAVLGILLAWPGQPDDIRKTVLHRLAEEADKFERSAHRFAAIETLQQTAYDYGERPRRQQGGTPSLGRAKTREIVSQYGFVPVDERGGSLREVRIVLSVDGQPWKRGAKSLEALAKSISANTEKQRRKLLEEFEHFGLRGVATDFGQLILLFSRGHTAWYEFTFKGTDNRAGSAMWVYSYQQLDGGQAVSIHEGKRYMRERIEGELWVEQKTARPFRITIDTNREVNEQQIRDLSSVEYTATANGMLLPAAVKHEQFADGKLLVRDEYSYAEFKEMFPVEQR